MTWVSVVLSGAGDSVGVSILNLRGVLRCADIRNTTPCPGELLPLETKKPLTHGITAGQGTEIRQEAAGLAGAGAGFGAIFAAVAAAVVCAGFFRFLLQAHMGGTSCGD